MTSDDDAIWNDYDKKHIRNAIDQHPLRKNSSYRRLIEAVSVEVCKIKSDEQFWLFDQGVGVIETIMCTVNIYGSNHLDEKNCDTNKTYWFHQNQVWLRGKKPLEPYISVDGTREAAITYLHLPYRVPALDRLLVDMLVASELFAYADEVQPILNKKMPLVLSWLLSNILSVIVGCAIAAFCFWIGDGGTVMNWVGGIILALTLLATMWSIIAFPFAYPKVRANHTAVEGTIGAI